MLISYHKAKIATILDELDDNKCTLETRRFTDCDF